MKDQAAGTALGPMFIVAVDQCERSPLVRDELAHRMLPTRLRILARLLRWRALRHWMIRGMERTMPGGWAIFLCRKRYVEDQAVDAVHAGVEAVVILGAGFDTIAYRLPFPADMPVYEVDVPENIERKRARLRKLPGGLPDQVTLVPVDVEARDLRDALAEHGYRFETRTLFVWEAVTQYLTTAGVRKTMEALAGARTGSRLVFTYIRKDFLDGTARYGSDAAYERWVVKERLWHFGLHPAEVADFLAEYGWTETEQAGPRELTDRYIQPSGRDLTVSEIERSVCAEKA